MSENNIENIRHSLAHLLAQAVLEKYPHAKPTIGPAVDDGFYYDFDFSGGDAPGDADLKDLQTAMRKNLKKWTEWEHQSVGADEARETFSGNEYKVELIDELEKEGSEITLYTCGGFTDLCRGGHAENPSKDIDPKSFTLSSVAGAYWRGDENKAMLTRIYGLAFESADALKKHLEMLEEAKKRDHRKLGKELDLFTFSPLVGSGLPMFTPRGTVLRDKIHELSQKLRMDHGFERVWIPHITKKDLYETSGHWDKFGDELFLVKSQETSDQLVMKPMNCPHHQQIYASQKRSYKDLPIKYLETTTIYRDEKAGELLGLSRVRSITQDDSHVFCTPDQLDDVYSEILEIVKTFYEKVDMPLRIRLSFRDPNDPDAYLGDEKLWEKAQKILKETAEKFGLDFYEAEGEAAFYGPKIDFMAIDSIGREWQVATAQLDFVQPARFKITYTDQDGSEQTPIMIHLAIAGSLERFLSVYIEHTAGNFPVWIAPEQVRILPISEKHAEYAQKVYTALRNVRIRSTLDESNESLGKRIRNANVAKVPYFLVLGDDEVKSENVTVESREHGKVGTLTLEEFIARIQEESAL